MNKIEKITIDKTIEIFEGIKKGISPWYPEPYYDMAINTMRKYQKIQEIVIKWQNETDPKVKFARSNIENIKEVIEDENDD